MDSNTYISTALMNSTATNDIDKGCYMIALSRCIDINSYFTTTILDCLYSHFVLPRFY